MYSEYAFGLEEENAKLKAYNKELIAQIGRLASQIEELQDIIRKQQKAISKLVSYIKALEAEIARQASIIRQLQARVAYLERVVIAQQREISRLRYVVARQQQIIRYQAGVIRYQAGVISYYKGVVNVLGFRLWGGTPRYAWVMNSIHSFRGIPGGAFAYDNISRLLAGCGSSGGGGSGSRQAADIPGNWRQLMDEVPALKPGNWRQLVDDLGSFTPQDPVAWFREMEDQGWVVQDDGSMRRNVCGIEKVHTHCLRPRSNA